MTYADVPYDNLSHFRKIWLKKQYQISREKIKTINYMRAKWFRQTYFAPIYHWSYFPPEYYIHDRKDISVINFIVHHRRPSLKKASLKYIRDRQLAIGLEASLFERITEPIARSKS